MLLPQMEQRAMYDAANFQHAASHLMIGSPRCCGPNDSQGKLAGSPMVNTTVARATINHLLCPSDPGDKLASTSYYYSPTTRTTIRGVKTSYDFVVYANYVCNGWSQPALVTSAYCTMFGENSNTKINMVTDGLSNTLAMVEKTKQVENGEGPPPPGSIGAGSRTGANHPMELTYGFIKIL
jgi:uncharacterized protein DUF1559